jgi:hypothetical protein
VEGVALTPGGRLLSETVTGSEYPFTALVVTVNVRAEPPLWRVMELGAAVIVKSGSGAEETETSAVAAWEFESAEPVTVTMADVGSAELAAESINCPSWPGESESLEGVAVTPAGKPLTETLTALVNPFTPPAVTIRARAEPPLWRVIADGAAAIVKFGRMAGPEEDPQPRVNVSAANNAKRGDFIGTGVLCKGITS